VSDGGHECCEACGFDGSVYDDVALAQSIDALGERWRALLVEAAAELRVRPSPDIWSALEYAAHSRDITALHAFGVEQALTQDEPRYPAIEADAMIEASAMTYNEEEHDAVVAQLDREARRLAACARSGGAANWSRGMTIGEQRHTVRRLLEHALHDSIHHLDDVERGLQSLRS